jgi:hypothetical protein
MGIGRLTFGHAVRRGVAGRRVTRTGSGMPLTAIVVVALDRWSLSTSNPAS